MDAGGDEMGGLEFWRSKRMAGELGLNGVECTGVAGRMAMGALVHRMRERLW